MKIARKQTISFFIIYPDVQPAVKVTGLNPSLINDVAFGITLAMFLTSPNFDAILAMLILGTSEITVALLLTSFFSSSRVSIITDYLPLSRTTVSQHLKELRDIGLIHGEIDGLKINYCLCSDEIEKYLGLFENFFVPVKNAKIIC